MVVHSCSGEHLACFQFWLLHNCQFSGRIRNNIFLEDPEMLEEIASVNGNSKHWTWSQKIRVWVFGPTTLNVLSFDSLICKRRLIIPALRSFVRIK